MRRAQKPSTRDRPNHHQDIPCRVIPSPLFRKIGRWGTNILAVEMKKE